MGACLIAALSLAASAAQAQVVQGQLELQWGDPQGGPGHAKHAGRFLATVVADDGQRYPMEPAQAIRAAENLYSLINRRVAVEFSPAKRAGQWRQVEAIVPADGLSASPRTNLAKALAPKAVNGNTRWVTVACKFADIATEQKTVAFFQGQYGTAPGQLGHYWPEVSYGKINLAGSDAYGWFTLPQPRSFYVTGSGQGDANLNQLFKDCAAAADPTVDFNGVAGINMMFNGDLDGYAWGGSSCGILEGVNKCIRNTWNPPWAFNNLAPLAHEMGHGYGLPHSDNSDGDSDPYDNPWDVMSDSWSNAVPNATYGSLPKHINIYQRDRLGWVDAARKVTIPALPVSRTQITLDFASLASTTNTQMVVLNMPPQNGQTVIYTLEARRPTGDYEARLAGTAVIIHRVQGTGMAYSQDADVPPANVSNNEGSMFKLGERWVSPDNSQWVQIEAATATGFVVSVGPQPRTTGGPAPVRRSGGASQAGSQPVVTGKPAAPRPTDPRGCAGSDRNGTRNARCDLPLK